MKLLLIALVFGAARDVPSASSGKQRAMEPQDAIRFRAEYAASIRSIQNVYHDFSYVEQHTFGSSTRARHQRIAFMNLGKSLRLDIRGDNVGHLAIVASPSDVFQMEKSPALVIDTEQHVNGGSFRLVPARLEYVPAATRIRNRANLLSAPTYFYTSTIAEFIDSPRFRFTGAVRRATRSVDEIRLNWQSPVETDNGETLMRTGYFVVSSQNGWLPTEYSISFGNDAESGLKTEIVYGARLKGVPFATQIRRYNADGKLPSEVISLIELDADAPAASDFTRESFGLPAKKAPLPWLWIGIIAVAFTTVWLLRRATNRRLGH